MRAVYFKDDLGYSVGDLLTVDGDAAHHLLKVVRIEKDEKLLVYNGAGVVLSTSVQTIEKKRCHLLIEHKKTEEYHPVCDLAVGLTKKEAWEDVLRFAVELKIGKLFSMVTDYSQRSVISKERSCKIIENAIIQSNNAFGVDVTAPIVFKDLQALTKNYEQVLYLSERPLDGGTSKPFKNNVKTLLVIGPEGGFSLEEDRVLCTLQNLCPIHLPTCIMRVPTAVCVATGFFLGRKEVEGADIL